MARTRFNEEEILDIMRQIELSLSAGSNVASACRSVGLCDATCYAWRKKYGVESILSTGKSQLREMKELEKGTLS